MTPHHVASEPGTTPPRSGNEPRGISSSSTHYSLVFYSVVFAYSQPSTTSYFNTLRNWRSGSQWLSKKINGRKRDNSAKILRTYDFLYKRI
jgi:hypothetical protein